MKLTRFALAVCLFSVLVLAQTSTPKPPATPRQPVTDDVQGVKVSDDYRWLENWDDPAVKQWSAAQNARTREYLDHLPARDAIKDRLKKLVAASSATYFDLQFRAGMLFAERDQPPQQQPVLVVMRSADDPASARAIFDPNTASAQGSVAVDFYVPSFGGKYVAAALSEGGSEDASAHVFEVATGKELSDVVPRVNFATAGGSIAWKADSSGFYYTRYPQGNERPKDDANFYQQVYFHKLGTDPKQDAYVIGKEFPRIAEIQLHTSDDGRWLLAAVENGDGGQYAHYLMDMDGHWTELTHFEDGIVSVKFGADPALYLLSRKDAPADKFCACPSDNASTESNTIPSIWRKRRSWFRSHPAPVATKPTAPPLKISFPPGAIYTWSISWEGPRECVSSTINVEPFPHRRSRPSPRLTAVFRSVAGTTLPFVHLSRPTRALPL